MKKSIDSKELCIQLMHADTQDVVVAILKTAGFWDDPRAWRYYGDKEGNWSQIGAQQALAESSLAEKIMNSIDARLMGACQAAGIDPEGSDAPTSINGAVAQFFGSRSSFGPGDSLPDWMDKKRLELARGITIAVTGERYRPSISIADIGEGQRPDRIPDTFVSLDKQNKVKVKFVQGKFNMGGSGVLPFCGGPNYLQFVLTRRDPTVSVARNEEGNPDAHDWGFTVVRRESTGGRNSTFTYLAPLGSSEHPHRGEVLRFSAQNVPIMPEGHEPYSRLAESGSLVKLYEYQLPRLFTGSAIFPDGLRSLLESRLPNPALPIRVHECRKQFRGHGGSLETYVLGLATRLNDNRQDNVEDGFPDTVQFSVSGQHLTAKVYALKAGKLKTYVKNDGVILTVNGQTHATLPKTFFTRKSVGMDRLASSILVMVDCSGLSDRAREDLFMTSRDRLRSGELAKQVEDQLEEIIGRHPGLKALKERRAREEIEDRLKDDQPLEKVLEKLFRSSPELVQLFPPGLRLGSPFKSGGSNGNKSTGGRGDTPFVGKTHPTFFRFEKRTYGQTFLRHFEVGRKCRLRVETDAVNDYFMRDVNHGELIVGAESSLGSQEPNWSVTLHDGIANITVDFGEDVSAGDEFTLTLTLLDPSRAQPFVNIAKLTAQEKSDHPAGTLVSPRQSNSSGKDNDGPGGLALPKIIPVREAGWAKQEFDQHSGCTLLREEVDGQLLVTFYVNVDNAHLKQSQKLSRGDPRLPEAQFVFGNVLLGLAMLQRFQQLEKRAAAESKAGSSGNGSAAAQFLSVGLPGLVQEVTRAAAPFLLPMIDRLGALTDTQVGAMAEVVGVEEP